MITIEEFADLLEFRSDIPAEALEALLEYAEISIFNINLLTGSIQLNNTTTKLAGYEAGELPENKNTKMMLTFEDDRDIVSEAMTSLMGGKTNRYHIEYRMKRKDGTLVSVAEFGLVLERDENGMPIRLCGLAQDLTRIRWAEEKARRSEKEIKAYAQMNNVDVLAHRIRMLHATNEAASMIISGFHQEYETVLRQALHIIADSVEADKAYILRNTVLDGKLCFFTRSVWGKDTIPNTSAAERDKALAYDDVYPQWKAVFNEQYNIRARVKDLPPAFRNAKTLSLAKTVMFVPLYLQGDFFGVLGFEDHTNGRNFSEDEADIMRAGALTIAASIARNEMLQQLNKAREAAIAGTKAKAEFLSRMSHEIRTPINAIIGMTTLAKKNKDQDNNSHYLDMIDLSSKQLLGLINDILDISKIDEGKLEILSEPFDFEEMLNSVIHMSRIKSSEKHQDLLLNTNINLSREMIGDQLRLSQVLINLLGNSTKFTPEGGKITLTIEEKTSQHEGDTNTGSPWLRFSVSDTGIGISPGQQSNLFQVFEQADGSITRTYGGSGLGLSICKKIVNLMGGDIWVESEEGKGSDFIFEIPVVWGGVLDRSEKEKVVSISGEETNPLGETPDWSGRTFLLVEDIEINREIVLGMLENTGAEIVMAVDGEEGVEVFKNDPEKFDLILMDIQMPKMDGLTATRLIREMSDESAERIPILAMTANAFKDDIDACLAAGMNAHIAKPIDYDELIRTITKYLK